MAVACLLVRRLIDPRSDAQRRQAAKSILGDFEQTAGGVVARLTGQTVTIQDDNSQQRMPDLRIDYANGKVGFVEVVVDIDEHYGEMTSRLRQLGGGELPRDLAAPELHRIWFVTLSGRARLKDLDPAIGALLAALESAGEFFQLVPGDQDLASNANPDVQALHRLGVVGVQSRPTKADDRGAVEAGLIHMYPAGVVGSISDDWAPFVDWLNGLLVSERLGSKCAKLRRAGGHERHLFIGTSYTTDGVALWPLSLECAAIPDVSPQLPEDMTHLWLMGAQTPIRCLQWSSEHGWRDVMRHWATD